MTEVEYHEALLYAAEKLTSAIKEYEEVTKLRARVEELLEENSVLRETCAYLRENR